MAARGGKALVLAMLTSFLVVQGTLGFDFAACYCHHNKTCMLGKPRKNKELHCMQKSLQACTGWTCSKTTPSVMPLADAVNPVTDEGSMAVPAGGADHSEFHITEGSVAAPAGGADHGEFNITEGSVAAPAGAAGNGEFNIIDGSVAAPAGGADHGQFKITEGSVLLLPGVQITASSTSLKRMQLHEGWERMAGDLEDRHSLAAL